MKNIARYYEWTVTGPDYDKMLGLIVEVSASGLQTSWYKGRKNRHPRASKTEKPCYMLGHSKIGTEHGGFTRITKRRYLRLKAQA